MPFKEDLIALLDLYGVYICFDCGEGSDTHGLYDESIQVVDNVTGRVLLNVEGYSMSARDLKEL